MRIHRSAHALAALCTLSCNPSDSVPSRPPELRAERPVAPDVTSPTRTTPPDRAAPPSVRRPVPPQGPPLVVASKGRGRRGCVRFTVGTEDGLTKLPARLIVRGVGATPDPDFGFDDGGPAAHNILVAVGGHGRMNVAPGRYDLTFAHGPEWSIDRREVEVTDGPCAEVHATLDHVIPMGDWTGCDMHVHAKPSYDAHVSSANRVGSLVAEGVEMAFPTEHIRVGNYAAGVAALPADVAGDADHPALRWVPSMEVSTHDWGHFNLFMVDARGSALPTASMTPRQVFRLARANSAGVMIQVNHPRMAGGMGYFNQVDFDAGADRAGSSEFAGDYDTLEVFNGFQLRHPEKVDRVVADWMELLRHGHRYVGTASSDAHNLAYQQAGYPRTYVYTPGAGSTAPPARDVMDALKAGHAFGTSGPMLFARAGDAIPGDTVAAGEDGTVTVSVRVEAAAWVDVDTVEVWVDGVKTESRPVPASTDRVRFAQDVTVRVAQPSGFVVVIARGDRPLDEVMPTRDALPFAFTNPIWYRGGPAAATP